MIFIELTHNLKGKIVFNILHIYKLSTTHTGQTEILGIGGAGKELVKESMDEILAMMNKILKDNGI